MSEEMPRNDGFSDYDVSGMFKQDQSNIIWLKTEPESEQDESCEDMFLKERLMSFDGDIVVDNSCIKTEEKSSGIEELFLHDNVLSTEKTPESPYEHPTTFKDEIIIKEETFTEESMWNGSYIGGNLVEHVEDTAVGIVTDGGCPPVQKYLLCGKEQSVLSPTEGENVTEYVNQNKGPQTHTKELKEHQVVHTGPFGCNKCHKSFSQSWQLKLHMEVMHIDSSRLCDICGKIFCREQNFVQHMKRHIEKRPHKCESFVLYIGGNLVEHVEDTAVGIVADGGCPLVQKYLLCGKEQSVLSPTDRAGAVQGRTAMTLSSFKMPSLTRKKYRNRRKLCLSTKRKSARNAAKKREQRKRMLRNMLTKIWDHKHTQKN